MRSHPPADVYADGRKFFFRAIFAGPDSSFARDSRGPDSKFLSSANHGFFELPHVPHHIAADCAQIQNRVADDLPWPVIGNVAAASTLKIFDALLPQNIF